MTRRKSVAPTVLGMSVSPHEISEPPPPDTRDVTQPMRFAGSAGLVSVIVVASAAIVVYVTTALQRIGYPYELQFFEGSTVEVSARVTEGLPLYGPPTTDFTPWPYPPLYFWVTGQLAHLTGINLPTLRAVSFVASLVSLLLIVLVVRRVTRSAVAGLVAAGLFAGTYRVTGAWFDAARVDSLLVMLLLAAILVALHARTWRGGVALGSILFLAFLTKQNALIVAVPILLWLLWIRRSVGVAAGVVLASTAIGSIVLGDILTDGWYSPYVVTQLLGHGAVLVWLAEFWVVDLLLPFGIVLVGAAFWWWAPRTRDGRVSASASHPPPGRAQRDVGVVVASVVGLWLAALAGRLHDGGYINVAIPAHVGMALLLGLLAAAMLQSPATTSRLLLGAASVLALQLVVMAAWHGDVVPSAADRTAGDRFVASLRDLPGAVLVPSHPYYLRLAGLPPHASAIAVDDLLASRPSRSRDALTAQLPWSLDGVSAVLLDAAADARLFGPALTRDFTLVTAAPCRARSSCPRPT